jgi:hypothetical protein
VARRRGGPAPGAAASGVGWRRLQSLVSGPLPEAEAVLRALHWRHSKGRNPPEHWFTSLADPTSRQPVRPEVRRVAALVLQD